MDAHPTKSSTLLPCFVYHDTTLRDDRLPNVTKTVTEKQFPRNSPMPLPPGDVGPPTPTPPQAPRSSLYRAAVQPHRSPQIVTGFVFANKPLRCNIEGSIIVLCRVYREV